MFPIFLIVTLRFGIFAPVEAAAFAVVYAIFVGKVIHRELTWEKFLEALLDTAEDNAVIMFIVSMAAIPMYALAFEKVPVKMSSLIINLTNNPILIMLAIMVLLLLAGMIMEGTVNTLLLTPILLPIVREAGFDPVHFGIIFAILIQLGGSYSPRRSKHVYRLLLGRDSCGKLYPRKHSLHFSSVSLSHIAYIRTSVEPITCRVNEVKYLCT